MSELYQVNGETYTLAQIEEIAIAAIKSRKIYKLTYSNGDSNIVAAAEVAPHLEGRYFINRELSTDITLTAIREVTR